MQGIGNVAPCLVAHSYCCYNGTVGAPRYHPLPRIVGTIPVNWIELNCFDPISRIYPHDPPCEDRANGHIGALNYQMADVLQGLPLPSPSEQIYYPK